MARQRRADYRRLTCVRTSFDRFDKNTYLVDNASKLTIPSNRLLPTDSELLNDAWPYVLPIKGGMHLLRSDRSSPEG
jgi:hypothetical protein